MAKSEMGTRSISLKILAFETRYHVVPITTTIVKTARASS